MRIQSVWPFAVMATVVSCGGGGADVDGNIAGLQTPAQVTIVEADDSGISSLRLPSGTAGAGLTAYESDSTRLYVQDDSMGALKTINNILSALDQTNYDDASVLNAGPYLALVDFEGGGGGNTSGNAPQYEEWIIDSSRLSNSAPHIVKFWIKTTVEGPGGEVRGTIYGRATIRQSPTDSNPVGDFTLYFKALTRNQAHNDPATRFEGYLTTVARNDGQSEYAFYMSHGDLDNPDNNDIAVRERCRVVGNPQAETGRAYTEQKQAGNFGNGLEVHGEEFHVQFNPTHLVRKRIADSTAIRAFDRDNFTTYIHRYGLYDADGARVDRQSGFPVDTLDGKHGWVGYHGMWFPPEVTITDGQQLLRRSFQPGQPPQLYTAVVVPGRLEKRTKRPITLGDVVNEDLETFDNLARETIRVRWTGSDLVKNARRLGNGWDPIEPPVSIVGAYNVGQFVHLFAPHRGGIELQWPSEPLSNATVARVQVANVITDTSPELATGDLPLFGYVRRLKAAITQPEANYTAGQVPYFPDAMNVIDVKNYLFDKETLLLKLDDVTVGLAPGVVVNQGPGINGFECGPMVVNALTDLAELSQQTSTYVWMTGPNQWNQLRTVRNAEGAMVNFDPPLVFDYTHHEPGSPFDGRHFLLEWDGSHLGGIPYVEGPGNRFYPQFNIPTGTTLTTGGATYRVKQLEGQQLMNEIMDVGGVMASQGFDLTTNLLAPPTANYVDPAIGALPDLGDVAPRFVGGKSQSGN